jgi:hypothetical protein
MISYVRLCEQEFKKSGSNASDELAPYREKRSPPNAPLQGRNAHTTE